MIILLTLITISLGNRWILLGGNWSWSPLGLKGLIFNHVHVLYYQPLNKIILLVWNVSAVDHNRVMLPTLPGVPGSDYMNGNYIKVRPKLPCSSDRRLLSFLKLFLVMWCTPRTLSGFKCNRHGNTGCKESQFYSLSFGQAVASMF